MPFPDHLAAAFDDELAALRRTSATATPDDLAPFAEASWYPVGAGGKRLRPLQRTHKISLARRSLDQGRCV